MKEIANKFYELGFNIFCTNNRLNENNFEDNNLMKAPFTKKEFNEKQTTNEFNLINWENATGFGVFLGYNELCAIDIDGVIDQKFINTICRNLDLPETYQWIFKSGSQCGYHILLKCTLPNNLKTTRTHSYSYKHTQQSKPYEFGSLDTNAYYPYSSRKSYFFKIEFKWHGNIVLPPSLHQSGGKYSFLNGIPNQQPISIDFKKLISLKDKIASEQAKSSNFDFLSGQENPIKRTSYHLTYADSIPYNFQSKFKEQGLIFNISQFSIHDSIVQPLFMNQITWFIIDCNFNIIKRKTFNYYSVELCETIYCNTLDYNISNEIIHSKRFIYQEFLFDLMHAEKLLCWDTENLRLLKEEITIAGLYHDSFLKELRISEKRIQNNLYDYHQPDENDIKPTIFIKELLEEFKTSIDKEWLDDLIFKSRIKRLSEIEGKVKESKNINSISFLTAFYTLYLIIEKGYNEV